MSDQNVFHTAFLNCFRPDGSLNRTRTWREVRYLVRFLSTLLVVMLLFLIICATPIVLVHSYVVPIPIALEIFGAYHLDPEIWEARQEAMFRFFKQPGVQTMWRLRRHAFSKSFRDLLDAVQVEPKSPAA